MSSNFLVSRQRADGVRRDRLPGRKHSWNLYLIVLVFLASLAMSSDKAFAFVSPMLDIEVQSALDEGRTDDALTILRTALDQSGELVVREDLLERIATILDEAGRPAEAGAAWVQLANITAERLGRFAQELVPILENGSHSFERAGDNRSAAELLGEVLAVMVAAGLGEMATPYTETLERLADISDSENEAYIRDLISRFEGDLEQARAAPLGGEDAFTFVTIYFGTDRARSGSLFPSKFYSGDRGPLEVGTARVSIPASHKPGQLEKPSIWSFDVRLDPERHIILSEVEPAPADEVFAAMRSHVETSGSKEAFVFVHGFNVSFADAARRTAQMAYDMNFEGLPILYSWPSRDSVLSYIADTAVVNLSGRRLSLFLEDVVKKSGAERIHLIAHSMGNRALTDALELYALRNQEEPPAFDQILFTAPDLDAGLFAEMARTISPIGKRLTLYASDKDWALAVSRRLHGDAQRAGEGGKDILLSSTFDTVDMTMVGEDMLAHSYFANNASALTDILSLFWRDASPEHRCGMIKNQGEDGLNYWHYVPEECDGDALLSTLTILKRGSVVSVVEARAFFNRYIGSPTFDPAERSRLLNALSKLFGS